MSGGIEPEVLAYLFEQEGAGPPSPAIAAFSATPFRDGALQDPNIRAVMAAKLARILPELTGERFERVQGLAIRALEALARDQTVRVREALAGAIKDVACAPHAVCLRLAHDLERTVAEPVLRYCLTLTDDDLRAIILGQPTPWALTAIAARPQVSAPVADALYHSGDLEATAILITNPGATIPEPTLELMVGDAVNETGWQSGLAQRPGLPDSLALRLARFVDHSVLEFLRARADFDPATSHEIVAVARRRLDWLEATVADEPPEHRARRLLRAGLLDDQPVGDALSWGQLEFVRAALSLLSGIAPALIDRIFRSKSPRAVTALAWRARLTMRTAVQLQLAAAGIPARVVLNARDGTDYPLTAEEMTWQLDLFGISVGG